MFLLPMFLQELISPPTDTVKKIGLKLGIFCVFESSQHQLFSFRSLIRVAVDCWILRNLAE